MNKLPSKTFNEFLKRFNHNRYRQDLSQSMQVKRAGGISTKIKLFWIFELSEHGTRVFQPNMRVSGVIKELNWQLRLQDKLEAPQFELDNYIIKAGQSQFIFEITLKRTS